MIETKKERKKSAWNIRRYVIGVGIIIFFFVFVIFSYQIQIKELTNRYEDEICELQSMISVSNIVERSDCRYDIDETAREFLKYFYGISTDVSKEYRDKMLKRLMTQDAYNQYDGEQYDNMYGYENRIDNIQIYVNEETATDTSVTACIFFYENIKWPNIQVITNPKYWIGEFSYDSVEATWKISKIIKFEQLISEEEYHALNVDTNGFGIEEAEADNNPDRRTIQEEGADEE